MNDSQYTRRRHLVQFFLELSLVFLLFTVLSFTQNDSTSDLSLFTGMLAAFIQIAVLLFIMNKRKLTTLQEYGITALEAKDLLTIMTTWIVLIVFSAVLAYIKRIVVSSVPKEKSRG